MKRYLIAVLAFFLLIALGIVLISSRPHSKSQRAPVVTPEKQLHEYAGSSNAKVVFTTQGSTVGDDQFRSIRLTVARDYRQLDVLDSYTNRIEKSKTFPNNQAAFDTFLRALEHAGYTTTQKVAITDERGVCPIGYRYIYELKEGEAAPQRIWSTSCGRKLGTFGGDAAVVNRLFQMQITNYNSLVAGIKLL